MLRWCQIRSERTATSRARGTGAPVFEERSLGGPLASLVSVRRAVIPSERVDAAKTEALPEQAECRLAELRQALGLTQYQLAEMIGRSRSAVSQIEHGEIALPLDMLRQIVAQLGGEVEITAVFKDRQLAPFGLPFFDVSQLFRVVPASQFLPDRVVSLVAHADQEGIRIVSVVRERWEDESERYQGRGERILAAVADDQVVGVGALSQCPHVSGALRMRRFYVAPAWRRHGVARSIAEDLIATGHAYSDLLTCNARASAAAGPFWESVGFIRVDTEGITHVHQV